MPVTALDPKSALILVDLQHGIVSLPSAHPVAEILQRARLLADSFRELNLPVVLVHVTGAPGGRTERPSNVAEPPPPGWTELMPDLNQQPGDHVVAKRTWGAFTNTGLDGLLKSLGTTQLVIAGIATSLGVESTARHARELGYNVALAVDAMTDGDAESHKNSVTRIFPRLGETGTTAEIVRLLGSSRA